MPICWIIAGPNGAGKTSFALKYLPAITHCSRFINADLIAAGLSPLAPEREWLSASRLLLKEIESAILQGNDFAFETTLAGRSYLKLVQRLQEKGWLVHLIYLALPSQNVSKERVAERVKHGGHNIPIKDIERRFARSLNNLLYHFAPIVNHCRCYMNNNIFPEFIFEQKGGTITISHRQYFELLQREAKPCPQ